MASPHSLRGAPASPRVVMLFVLLAALILAGCAYAYPLHTNDAPIAHALDYLKSEQKSDGSIGGYAMSEWAVMAITAAGENASGSNWTSGSSLAHYVLDSNNQKRYIDDPNVATDVERHILTLLCLGVNPNNSSGTNYLQRLADLYQGGQIGDPSLLNDDFWGVVALIAAGVDPSNSTLIDQSVQYIKDNQNADGGWSFYVGGPSDTDDTALAVLALILSGEPATSSEVQRGMDYIKTNQKTDGGFISDPSFGSTTSSEATAWVMWAITSVGESPTSSDWTKGGNDPVDYLLTMQDTDGAFFHLPNVRSSTVMSTSYAIIALLGKRVPVVMSNTTTPEPSFTVVFAQTTIWADRTRVYEGQPFNVSVLYYDITDGKWRPLPGAEVRVGERVLTTDTSGHVSTSIDTAGTYTLRASKRYYNTSEFRIEVLPAPSESQVEVEKALGTPKRPNVLSLDESGNTTGGVKPLTRVKSAEKPPSEQPSTGEHGAVLAVCALLAAMLFIRRR